MNSCNSQNCYFFENLKKFQRKHMKRSETMYYNKRSVGNITKINEIHDNQAMKAVQSSSFES